MTRRKLKRKMKILMKIMSKKRTTVARTTRTMRAAQSGRLDWEYQQVQRPQTHRKGSMLSSLQARCFNKSLMEGQIPWMVSAPSAQYKVNENPWQPWCTIKFRAQRNSSHLSPMPSLCMRLHVGCTVKVSKQHL